ncbi:MAG: beta-ketoacyl-[acyl-carrier-protein] synthase family protein [Nannocystaceae bacterium]
MRGEHEVVITGLGVLSPIGLSLPELLASLLENRSGIAQWTSPLLARSLPAGLIPRDFTSEFTRTELPYLDRCSQLALLAARQAIDDAGIESFRHFGPRAGLYFGSVGGGVMTEHEWVRRFYVERAQTARPTTIMASMLNAAPAQISIRHQVLGPVMTHSSACTSSGAAIGDAMRAIRDGYLDIALAGGAEASLTPTFVGLWGGLRALAEPHPEDVARSCRPFSRDRSGLVLSEGAALLVLERRDLAEARGARVYGTLRGYGVASDGHHIGSPSRSGQVAALRAALDDARIGANEIAYVNAHATATAGGDPIEASALEEVLGAAPVSSTKAIHGHLLGAASALELMITTMAVHWRFLPATAFLEDADPACPLNHVGIRPRLDVEVPHALSLSAGFGGTNVALIVSATSAQLTARGPGGP